MDDESRFRALFVTAYPALHRYARHRGLPDHDAQDLVAATLEVAWRRLQDLPEEDPLPWLYGVARNMLLNRRRSERRSERLIARLVSREALRAPRDVVANEIDSLRQALAALDPVDQEILTLVAWDGLTPAQAAVALRCSPVAARSRLHRARNRLAAKLDLPGGGRQRSAAGGQIPSDHPQEVQTLEVHDG